RHFWMASGRSFVSWSTVFRITLIWSRTGTPAAGLTSERSGQLDVDTSASEYSFEYMKLTNSRAALRRLESLRTATAPGTITTPSDGKTTSIGLPLPFLASEKLSGPEPTTRSPETMSVTVSL